MKDLKKLALALLVLVVVITAGVVGLQELMPGDPGESQGAVQVEEPVGSESTSEEAEASGTADPGRPYATIEDNKPAFSEAQKKQAEDSFIALGDLDKHGRCTTCTASLSRKTMPGEGEEREDISMVHPTGWRSGEGWERCHLIGFQLSGLNAEKRNLITGTHYFNVEGMLPFENKVADYIRKTGNHVLYRITPVFRGKEMVARSVVMEALSVEDGGRGVCYHVEVFNKAENAEINYKTGEVDTEDGQGIHGDDARVYVVNTNTGKFHYPSCSSVKSMSGRNRKEVTTKRSELIKEGYEPCGNCEP